MKKFDEFAKTVLLESQKITNKINKEMEIARIDNKDPKSLLGDQIASAAMTITLELLSRYHEWLTEELEKHSHC